MASYLEIVARTTANFSSVTSVTHFREFLSPLPLEELTIDDEEAALNVQLAPIPVQIRLFRFDELAGRFGVLEATFTEKSTLINVRVQLLFPGPDGIIKAACFWHDEFGPFVRSYFAPLCPGDHSIIGDAIRFSGQGMVGVARLLPGTNTVSFWLTDERYE